MAGFNQATVMGRLTRDPEMKYSTAGLAICNFDVATDFVRRKDQKGASIKEVEFHHCVAFGKTVEHVEKYMRKGSLILVQGSLRTNRWEDDAGTKRERRQIIVQNVVFGPKKGGREPGEDDDKWEYGEKPTDKSIEEDDNVPF